MALGHALPYTAREDLRGRRPRDAFLPTVSRRAARLEGAARRQSSGIGRKPGDRGQPLALLAGGARDGSEQCLRIGVQRPGKDGIDIPLLHDPARIHDQHTVAERRDQCEVVGDQHDRGIPVADQPIQQVQHLGLGRHVERGRRLVGDDDVGIVGQRDRDHDPLAHAAGVLVRIVVEPPFGGGHLDLAQQLDRPAPGRAPVDRRLVAPDRVDDLAADGPDRVERRHRVLEDERNLGVANPTQRPIAERRDRPAVEHHVAARDPARWIEQAEKCQRQRRLAAARLAHDGNLVAALHPEGDIAHHRGGAGAVDEPGSEVPDVENGRLRHPRWAGFRTRGSMRPASTSTIRLAST